MRTRRTQDRAIDTGDRDDTESSLRFEERCHLHLCPHMRFGFRRSSSASVIGLVGEVRGFHPPGFRIYGRRTLRTRKTTAAQTWIDADKTRSKHNDSLLVLGRSNTYVCHDVPLSFCQDTRPACSPCAQDNTASGGAWAPGRIRQVSVSHANTDYTYNWLTSSSGFSSWSSARAATHWWTVNSFLLCVSVM